MFNTPPKPPEVDQCNFDGSTAFPYLTANDFQAFLNAHARGRAWQDDLAANSPEPVRNLTASVNGQTVVLAWQNGSKPQNFVVVQHNGLVTTLPGSATSLSLITPPGTYTYTVTPVRNANDYEYPPVPGSPEASVTVTVAGAPPVPSAGWTDLPLPVGAIVLHVASNGNDSNPGTQAAPFRTIQRGYSALRDGQSDQLLLRCGDSWTESGSISITKGSSTPGQFMVIGSYGTGPRPKITFTGSNTGFYGHSQNKRGVAFVGLELVGRNLNLTNGITLLSWKDILIEDCYIRNFSAGVVVQDAESTGQNYRVTGLKIRRNVITDAWYVNAPDDGRAQGIYMGGCDDWLVEENTFDLCGVPGSIFGRPVYIHETCGRGTYRGNISARARAEGFQVRPGGVVHNNLSLRCPIGMFIGNDRPGVSDVQYNVVLESGDISAEHRRGIGMHISGNSIVKYNFVGYNTGTGWGTVHGMKADTGEFTGNFIYDWCRSPNDGAPGDTREGTGIYFSTGTGQASTTANRIVQARPGICVEIGGWTLTGPSNQFYQAPNSFWDPFRGGQPPSGWQRLTSAPADPQCTVPAITGMSVEAFVAEARKQSRQNWRAEFTAADFNAKVRARVGMVSP